MNDGDGNGVAAVVMGQARRLATSVEISTSLDGWMMCPDRRFDVRKFAESEIALVVCSSSFDMSR